MNDSKIHLLQEWSSYRWFIENSKYAVNFEDIEEKIPPSSVWNYFYLSEENGKIRSNEISRKEKLMENCYLLTDIKDSYYVFTIILIMDRIK